MNGSGIHVKQENSLNSESGQTQVAQMDIKREVADHSVLEYDDIEQEPIDGSSYGLSLTPNDVMAEDLSIVNDHIQDTGAMDMWINERLDIFKSM